MFFLLLQLFFRELPEPLCTYSLHRALVGSIGLCVGEREEVSGLLTRMPEPHLATLAHLMLHLHRISLSSATTGMTPRNLAIVWAPNLLRAPPSLHQEALTDEIRDIGAQARLVELLITRATSLFQKKLAHDRRSWRGTAGDEASLWKKVRTQLGALVCFFTLAGSACSGICVTVPRWDQFLGLPIFANSLGLQLYECIRNVVCLNGKVHLLPETQRECDKNGKCYCVLYGISGGEGGRMKAHCAPAPSCPGPLTNAVTTVNLKLSLSFARYFTTVGECGCVCVRYGCR